MTRLDVFSSSGTIREFVNGVHFNEIKISIIILIKNEISIIKSRASRPPHFEAMDFTPCFCSIAVVDTLLIGLGSKQNIHFGLSSKRDVNRVRATV